MRQRDENIHYKSFSSADTGIREMENSKEKRKLRFEYIEWERKAPKMFEPATTAVFQPLQK